MVPRQGDDAQERQKRLVVPGRADSKNAQSPDKNRSDNSARLSLRKSEMVRKSGVLLAASTRKAMSSWSRWAIHRDDATPTQ